MGEALLDLEALLAPLDGGDGAGEDLRADPAPNALYQRLRDARADARAEERTRDSEADAAPVVAEGWRHVRRLGTEALAERAKDFEVASFLVEALVRLEGLAGLAAGSNLLAGLLDQYWETGFPLPDEEAIEDRAAWLGGLAGRDGDGTVMQPLRRTTLYRRPSGEPFALYQYEAALETAGIADEERRAQRFDQGVLPMETVEAESRFGRAELRALLGTARAARAAWQALETALDARFGHDSPPTRRVSEVLERLAEVALRLGGEPEAELAAGAAENPGAAPGAVSGGPTAAGALAVPAGALASREQALRMLEQVAEFFEKTEPHSFLAYTLSEAVRRGRMSLPELLAEVLQDETARHAMLTALGIRPTAIEG
jgi:type VI secretion system protein ImpA